MSDNQSSENNSDQFHIDDGRDRSITSREAERQELEDAMLTFLSGGGAVQKIERDLRKDPPRRPESNYGSRPI
ncbi:hypothetical protein A9Q81_12265 [Gammaproteobacteria bacterium 42_54_T18]|nr:hypothetical protein A9Q81_12265 [Gammaproteobacteria bacterium 42_54_T18]